MLIFSMVKLLVATYFQPDLLSLYLSFSARYGDRSRHLKDQVLAQYGNSTMDECLSSTPEEYSKCFNCPPSAQALAFCGRDGGPCEDAAPSHLLEQAWSNAQSHYFVGLTERLKETVDLLEIIFPDFFFGASQFLAGLPPQKVTHTRAQFVEPSTETRETVARWASVDMQLYARLSRRFMQIQGQCAVVSRRRD